MSIVRPTPAGGDMQLKLMQQQIAQLEQEVTRLQQSLAAVAEFSQLLSSKLSTPTNRLPALEKVSAGTGKLGLSLRR